MKTNWAHGETTDDASVEKGQSPTQSSNACIGHQWLFDNSDDAGHMHWHCKNCGEAKVTTPKMEENPLIADREKLVKKSVPVLSELNEQIDRQEAGVHLATLFTFLFVKKFWQEATDMTVEGTSELRAALCNLSSEVISDLTRIIAFNFLWMIDHELNPSTLNDPKVRKDIALIFKLPEDAQDNFTELFNKFSDRGVNMLLADLLVNGGVIKSEHVETYVSVVMLRLSPVFLRQKKLVFGFINDVVNMMQSGKGSPQILKEMVMKFAEPPKSWKI